MRIYIDNYKDLVIITSEKSIFVNLPIKSNQNLKHDIKFIIAMLPLQVAMSL